MPTYEYFCNDCHKSFRVILTIAEHENTPPPKCPECGKDNVVQKIAAPAVITSKKS
jgi:putative FmdB family regulatory protein